MSFYRRAAGDPARDRGTIRAQQPGRPAEPNPIGSAGASLDGRKDSMVGSPHDRGEPDRKRGKLIRIAPSLRELGFACATLDTFGTVQMRSKQGPGRGEFSGKTEGNQTRSEARNTVA